MSARPHREHVVGAPFQPGDRVSIVKAIDVSVYDVRQHVGSVGRVAYLEYDCGCGQTYPTDPMIGVDVGGAIEEFWPEELASSAKAGGGR